MIKKIDHLVITSSDPPATLSFYEKLGFTAIDHGDRLELFAGDFKINVHILGKELFPHGKHVQPGSGDMCFEITGSLEAYQSHCLSKGLNIELGPVPRNGVKGGMQSVYLYDPDGNLIEFCSYYK